MTFRFLYALQRWSFEQYAFIPDATWLERGKLVGWLGLHLFNMGSAIHLCTQYIGRPSLMHGPSMLPTLDTGGEVVIEDRLSYWLNPKLFRGELVILRSPLCPNEVVCKRVLGLPGDIICVDPTGKDVPSTEHVVVPKNHVWISGDNMSLSRDSRVYGPVSISLIQARLAAKIYPLSRATIFRNPASSLE